MSLWVVHLYLVESTSKLFVVKIHLSSECGKAIITSFQPLSTLVSCQSVLLWSYIDTWFERCQVYIHLFVSFCSICSRSLEHLKHYSWIFHIWFSGLTFWTPRYSYMQSSLVWLLLFFSYFLSTVSIFCCCTTKVCEFFDFFNKNSFTLFNPAYHLCENAYSSLCVCTKFDAGFLFCAPRPS